MAMLVTGFKLVTWRGGVVEVPRQITDAGGRNPHAIWLSQRSDELLATGGRLVCQGQCSVCARTNPQPMGRFRGREADTGWPDRGPTSLRRLIVEERLRRHRGRAAPVPYYSAQ